MGTELAGFEDEEEEEEDYIEGDDYVHLHFFM